MSNPISFVYWLSSSGKAIDDWLILGKGPSFELIDNYDLSKYHILTLNHVIQRLDMIVEVAHLIDLDVFDTCQVDIYKKASYLVMPWVPHKNNKPIKDDLFTLIKTRPILSKLAEEGRLLYYNHLSDRRYGDAPLISVKFFSAEAAVNLLATAGVKRIRSLGVDGGSNYGSSFSRLSKTTLLANGRKSFNYQFNEIAKTIMQTGIDYAPLHIQNPIKVFVATTEAQMLAVKVLEFSIRKYASMSVEVIPLHLNSINIPRPTDPSNWPRTPFSFQRFLIPELLGYQGRAIYLDSDMLVFKDIKELWNYPFDGAKLLTVRNNDKSTRRPQFSVMLMDCEKLHWQVTDIVAKLDLGELDYDALMYRMCVAEPIKDTIVPEWNSLESYQNDITALLHYTDMNTQPWISRMNPLGYLWFRVLLEAVDAGFISSEFLHDQVRSQNVRPSLLYQVTNRIEDSLLLPKVAIKLDKDYVAPYQGLVYRKKINLHGIKDYSMARIRWLWRKSGMELAKSKLANRINLK